MANMDSIDMTLGNIHIDNITFSNINTYIRRRKFEDDWYSPVYDAVALVICRGRDSKEVLEICGYIIEKHGFRTVQLEFEKFYYSPNEKTTCKAAKCDVIIKMLACIPGRGNRIRSYRYCEHIVNYLESNPLLIQTKFIDVLKRAKSSEDFAIEEILRSAKRPVDSAEEICLRKITKIAKFRDQIKAISGTNHTTHLFDDEIKKAVCEWRGSYDSENGKETSCTVGEIYAHVEGLNILSYH